MEKRFAMAVSVVFQPMFVPIYSLVILFHANSYITYSVSPGIRGFIYLVTLANTVLLPAAMFYYFYRKGLIASFHMRTSGERLLPFLTALTFHLSTYYIFSKIPMPGVFRNLVLGAAASVFVALLVNLRWKISIHMLGMGGIVGTVIGLIWRYQIDAVPLVAALTVLSGLVGYARLRLNAHTPMQVYAGFVSGTLILIGSVVWL